MQVNPAYGQPPVYGAQPSNFPQPVVYRPSTSPYGTPDTYQPNRPPNMGGNPMQPPEQEYKYVAQQDVAFGLAGAVAGFFIAGPIGALIGGLGLLLISALARGIKHLLDKKKANDALKQQQQQQMMPAPPQYPYPNGSQTYQYQNQYDYGQNQNSAYRDPYQAQYMQPR